jgi:acyl-CoA thioesterase FadM
MAQAVYREGTTAVTVEMRVRFKKPVAVGRKVLVRGKVDERRGRLIRTTAALEDEEGLTLAEAEGKFLALSS